MDGQDSAETKVSRVVARTARRATQHKYSTVRVSSLEGRFLTDPLRFALCALAALVLGLATFTLISVSTASSVIGSRPAHSIASPSQIDLTAYNPSGPWADNDYVGYCGDTSGGFVTLAQAYLMNDGLYQAGTNSVDDYFGSTTENAVLGYQRYYGLSQDGCVGPSTWSTMQATHFFEGQSVCPNGANVEYFGDGGSTNGLGGFFTLSTLSITQPSLQDVTTGQYAGGPVASGTTYAFDNVLAQQSYCTGYPPIIINVTSHK